MPGALREPISGGFNGRPTSKSLIALMNAPLRGLLRGSGTPYAESGFDDPGWNEAQLIEFSLKHAVLINNPIVVTSTVARLCRPSEAVLDLLSAAQNRAFTKEGESVVDAEGHRAPF